MSSENISEIKNQFLSNKMGMTGIGILAILVSISIYAMISVPPETFQEWNNPGSWILYPKSAVPSWVNYFSTEKISEHKILDNPSISKDSNGELFLNSHQFGLNFNYDTFPNDFIYIFSTKYERAPLVELSVLRPDGIQLDLLRTSLPFRENYSSSEQKIFSTDYQIKKNLVLQSNYFQYELKNKSSEEIIFSQTKTDTPLKGNYIFFLNVYSGDELEITDSKLIIGGKSFGVMGTDELRRDLAIGLVWGTPLALFIGIVVSVASVVMGLLYGVYAGFRGKKTDEVMMRFNDVIYALPALPFLIILSVTISNSIFVLIGFLMIFGWVGIAKVSRSMSLQIKTRGYVEAAKTMGQTNSKIIFKHMLPQLLPYAFASIAISVPAAITTEAGLSFLGLGDPSFPTWGQILHDASTFGAAARGLWWWILPPGIMIAITGLAFVFIGNALDAIANPKLKR
jgi:peptide/nickel transport system permease protein